MITAVYLENPFKPQNRVIRQISAVEAPAVIDAVALLNANLSGEMILSVNGQKVAADHLLKDGDFVVIAPNVLGGGGGGGKNIAGIVAGIALMAFSGGAGAGLLGILGTTQGALGLGVALYFGGALLMGNQKAPSVDAPRMQGAFENGYNWSPNQIRLQPGSPMPITFGTIRTSGQLIARRVWSAEFAGKQTQYLGLLLAAGEGPLSSIADIEINDTPITSIQGATFEIRPGRNNQNPVNIAGLGATVEFQPFSSELPLSDAAWITKTQTEPGDKVTLDFVFPAGLYAVDTSSGATVACRGTIRWEYREVGAGSWITGGTNTYSQQARRPFYFTIDFTPPDKNKTYEFRAQNYSLKDFATTYGGGWTTATEMPGNYSVAISWVGLTVSTNYAQTYPGVALVAISLPATENLSGSMPKVSWKQTRATVNVWNPNTSQYEQRDAQNIAWMVYDLIHYCRAIRNLQTDVDDYVVFGEPKENLNYDAFSAWATFCAYEVSAGVQRAFGALLVDSAEQMWPAIQKIASTGRAFIIQQAGVFKPVWDSTRTMSQIFTSGNIIDGSLSGSFLPERERANAIEVSFINAENGYERDTLFVTSDDYSPANMENTTQVFLPGITSPKIAYMWAKHQLKKNKYLKRTAALQADIDSIVAELGDVVGIQSDITSWGVGGRIMGATTTSVVIDQAVTLAPGSTYSLLIRYPDNTLVRRVVDAVLVSTTTTTLNFTGAPWPTAPERYCVYSFGINTLETKPFQITGIRRNGDLQATLELLEYIEDVYTEATDFPVIDYTAANAGISSLTVKADSDTGKLGIAWTIPTDRDYTGSVVYVDGKPQGFFTTDVTDIDIDAPPGTHTVTVRPVDGSGNYGTETEEEVTLGSPTLSSVSAVSLTSTVRGQADGTNLVYITGTFTIPDLASSVLVEIGEGSNPTAWATVQDSRVAAVQYGPVLPGTLYTLRFTAKNRYAVSDPVLEAVTTTGDTTAPNAPSVSASGYLKVIKVEIALENPPSDLAGFEIWKNTENNANAASLAGYVAAVNGAAFFIDKAPSYLSEMYYWAKSVDAWGNKSPFSASSLPTHVSQILSGDITANQIVAKDFRTAQDVGATVDGVKFTADGIEMWEDGVRKVFIPVTGDPEFTGLLTAGAGHVGGWEIFPTYLQSSNIKLDSAGLLQTLDFVSGHKGWKINQDGNAEFNNLRARGAIKTVVFEKDEISVVGGRTLIRPAGVVKDYDYTDFINADANVYLEECWDKLNELLGTSDTYVAAVFADYDEYAAAELAYYNELGIAMGFNQFTCAFNAADYSDVAKDAYLTACWAQLMDLLDLTTATPAIPSMTFAAYETLENGYFAEVATAIDNPPFFEPFISDADTAIETDNADQFKVGDIIRVKDGLASDYWGRVSAIAGDMLSITGEYGEPFAITAGQTIVNYGIPGSGGILLDGQGPMMDVYTHDGAPWNGTDLRLRIGNLNGWGTINDDIYGIAIGNPTGEYLVYDSTSGRLRLNGAIQISEGTGIANFSDAGALAGLDDIDLSYVTDAGTLASANNLDDVGDGTTYKKTTANEKTGAARAYSGLDANNMLVTAVIPASAVSPTGAGLFLGSNYLGFYSGGWKTYMDNAGNFALIGGGTHGLSWNAATGVLTIAGSISILGGSGYGNLTDKPTNLAGINSTEGGKLAGIEAGADVTSTHTSADTALVAGTAAATVRDNAANALANAATAQSTANAAVSSAATANGLLANIAADNKLTPVEKQAARKEWDIIAAERPVNSSHAMSIAGFTIGIAEGSFNEAASDAYWSECWTKLNTLLGESNAEPAFPAQTFAAFSAEEAGYYTMVRQVIDSEPITVPPTPDVLALNTTYIAAFQALANYLNAGATWTTGIPSWISDANISATTDITGSTFRSTWKAYYDARTALLNAIAAKSKALADLAKGTADSVSLRVDATLDINNRVTTAVIPKSAVAPTSAGLFLGANYLGYHNGSDWKTYMDANGNFALAGTTGNHGLTWNAATNVLTVAGTINATSGTIANFTIATKDLTAGSGSTAIGISTDTSKKAFWAGSATPASAPFYVSHAGYLRAASGDIGGMPITTNGLYKYVYIPGVNRTTMQLNLTKFKLDAMTSTYENTVDMDMTRTPASSESGAPVIITPSSTSYYGLTVYGKGYFDSLYIANNCSAGSFTDRTEMPESMEEALEIINTMQPTKSKVDYKRLSNKAKKFTIQKAEDGSEYIEEGRDLTKTVSALVMVCQKLQEENIRLSDRLAKLEAPAIDEEREYIEAVDKAISENRGNIRARMEAKK